MRTKATLFVVLAPLLIADLNAQDREIGNCPTTKVGGAILRGRVTELATGTPLAGRGVRINLLTCWTRTDSSGWFSFRPLKPGTYTISVGDEGYRSVKPVTVGLRGDTTVTLTFQLEPADLLADCLESAACAPLFIADTNRINQMTGEDSLRDAALRTTLAVLRERDEGEGDDKTWTYCVKGVPPGVLARVGRLLSPETVVPEKDCTLDRTRGREWVRNKTGRPHAAIVTVGDVRGNCDLAVASTSYYVGPLWAAGWSCTLRRRDGRWVPVDCRLVWIS